MSDPKPAEAKRLAARLLEFATDSCCDEDDDPTGDDLRASAALLLSQAERIAELKDGATGHRGCGGEGGEMIDWLSMSTAEQLAALKAAPRIAGPWKCTNDAGGGVKLYEEPGCLWTRREMYPGFSTNVVFVQPHTGCPGWSAHVLAEHLTNYLTAEDAKSAADRVLTESGWRLL